MEVDVTGHVGFFDLLELMKLARTKLDNKLAAFHQTIFRLGDSVADKKRRTTKF